METITILLVSIVGFGILMYNQGKREGYIKGRNDEYKEYKNNNLK